MTEDRPGEAPVGYVATDPDGLVTAANDLVLGWLGRERSDVVGRLRFSDLLAGGGRIYYETHLAPSLLMTGSTGALAVDLATVGGPVPVFVTAVLDRDEAGAPERIRFGVVDAAERRSYELELLAERQRAEASERHARLVAQTLQQVLLPPGVPEIDGLDAGSDRAGLPLRRAGARGGLGHADQDHAPQGRRLRLQARRRLHGAARRRQDPVGRGWPPVGRCYRLRRRRARRLSNGAALRGGPPPFCGSET